jgi:hypothetical protein
LLPGQINAIAAVNAKNAHFFKVALCRGNRL